MKKLDLKSKINMNTAVSFGLTALGVVQLILTNKKESNDKAKMKTEILEELKETIEKK